ncbi:MAG: TnpV protein [Clostridia bacterium]|nr:TnpV protein [Clostridia bacterium]
MKESYTDKKTGINYTLVGKVYLPNLISTDTDYPIGLWGRRHLEYIKKHRHSFYVTLKKDCKLNTYLHEVDKRAAEMYERIVKDNAEKQGITEKLKTKDMLKWARAMNNIANQARETVMHEVICPEEII